MERDFMGLNSKDEAIQVLLKSSAIQWSLSSTDLSQKDIGEEYVVPREPAQLTIFYNGMVNVYNDMSPEKAQAIMLFAGNGTRAQTLLPTPRTPAEDGVQASQAMNTTLSSLVSVSPSTATDAPKAMSSMRRVMQSNVPQMRGASLARFLEKRKERVMASTPYSKPGSSSAPRKDDKN